MKKHNKIKKILIYCPILEYGGIATTLINIANYLIRFYEINIFTNSININTKKKLNTNIKIVDIKNKKILDKRLINSVYVYLTLIKYISKDTLILSLQDHLPILILNKLFSRKKIIIRTSSVILNKYNKVEYNNYKQKFLKIISTYFYCLASLVITYSNTNVKILKSRGVKNVICIYNYFKKNNFYKMKKKKILNLFFIGRLSKEKDPEFFLKNLINFKNINLHFVAEGNLKNKLKQIAQNKKNVFFHGYVDNPFIKFKNKINLLCITSKYEGTPNVLGEAMSYKIPVIAPKNIGLVNYFLKNGIYGYLYRPNDNDSFKMKIKYIINNYSEAKRKANKGYKFIDRFSKENTLGVLKKAISNL